jgi:hypothetical protein
MKWYKHQSDFRRSPAMLHVQDMLGDYGVAAAYRLYEVFAQRFGINDDFTGTIMLSPPFSETWLAREILTYDYDDDNTDDDGKFQNPEAKLLYFLGVCESAGLITQSKQESAVLHLQNDGTQKVTGKKVWTTITIPGFASLKDDWTGTKKATRSKALSTPE